jgi:lipid II:glycine glycyltransferase (peptidoglycan interpeptide bridge formation enzyme)
MLKAQTIEDQRQWNTLLRGFPTAHILQTWEWGEFKRETTGWQPVRLAFWRGGEVCALVSLGVRRVGIFQLMYAPKAPILLHDDDETWAFVLDYLQDFARKRAAVWLKIDPDVILATGAPAEADDAPDPNGTRWRALLQQRGWRFSADQVQFRNTIKIDLTLSEDDLLAAMSSNTRRKIRVAERDGVTVRAGTAADLPILYELYRQTGQRDDFLVRPQWYYESAWRTFIEAGLAQPLIAEFEGKPIAHVILFHFGRTCWYFYGASGNEERQRMPNYLLQWEAMRWAKARGYGIYDLWGAPDQFVETDSLWGVYAFKRGFRGTVTRHIGAWDYAPYPPLYWGYTQAVPRLRAWLRRKNA